MTQRTHCLKRIGENVKKYKIIILDGKDEVTVGRNPDVTVCILSTMISRCHAVLKKTESGSWTIKDNKSLNGVFVNDKKLEPLKPYCLEEGDIVQLGVRTSPDIPPEFLYKYYNALKVKRVLSGDVTDGKGEEKQQNKRARIEECYSGTTCSSSNDVQPGTSRGSSCIDRLASPHTDRLGHMHDKHSPFHRYKKEIDEQELQAAAKLTEMEAKLKEMQEKLKAKESAQIEMAQELQEEKQRRESQLQALEELKEKEENLKLELEQKQVVMAREKEELQEKMREKLEDELQMKEASLLEGLEKHKQALLKEKQAVEEKLKQELESEREKDKKLALELLQQQQILQQVIQNKEAEQKLLESQLKDTRQEKDRKQEEVLRAREDVLSNFAELMETELQCSICSELFIRATSLNCSHSFCSLCIAQWMKVKKECPQCRAAITTHMRSIVLDSYIEKMVDQFSEEMKSRRHELVDERKKEEEAFEIANKPAPAPAARGGRGRGRGGRGRRGGRSAPAPPPLPELPPPMMISSDSEDDDDDLDGVRHDDDDSVSDSDSSMSGDGYSFYGGYGRCYTCGRTGHWANACPFR